MLVEEIMIKDVITIRKNNTIEEAYQLLTEKGIRHLPVVDDSFKCIGIITDRDIRSAIPSVFRKNEDNRRIFEKPIETIMQTECITAHPLDFVEEAATIFYKYRIGCLPVVKNQVLVGILTQTDILRAFVELTGAHLPGSQIEVRTKNLPGMLSDVLLIIRKHRVRVQSVLMYPEKNRPDSKVIVLRLNTINPNPIIASLKEHQYEVLWPSFPTGDHNE